MSKIKLSLISLLLFILGFYTGSYFGVGPYFGKEFEFGVPWYITAILLGCFYGLLSYLSLRRALASEVSNRLRKLARNLMILTILFIVMTLFVFLLQIGRGFEFH